MKRHATDHRAVVLESVATAPGRCTAADVVADARSIGWTERQAIASMLFILVREGLIGRGEDGSFFLTKTGLAYLQEADFTRKVPEAHQRPKARRKKT